MTKERKIELIEQGWLRSWGRLQYCIKHFDVTPEELRWLIDQELRVAGSRIDIIKRLIVRMQKLEREQLWKKIIEQRPNLKLV